MVGTPRVSPSTRDTTRRLQRAARRWRRPPVVLTNLESFVGLQAARLLCARGIPVVGLTDHPGAPQTRTHCVTTTFDAGPGGIDTIQVLEDLAPAFQVRPVLIPCSDEAVQMVSAARASLEYQVVLPPQEVIDLLTDKGRFLQHVSRIGVPTKPFRILRLREDVVDAGSELEFPVVVKPVRKNSQWDHLAGGKAAKVSTSDELLRLWDRVAPSYPVLVQEWIGGGDNQLYLVNAYFGDGGEPLATFVARKLRQWPPHIGVASLSRECRNDEVLEGALKIFQSLPYRGLAELEMKWDAKKRAHFAIEANVGRPTGLSAIAEAGGVELLQTAYCDALGLPLPQARTQSYGDAGWIYASRDLASAMYYRRHGDLTLGQWWRSIRGIDSDAVFSWHDPVPFLLDSLAGYRRVRRSARTAPPASSTVIAAPPLNS